MTAPKPKPKRPGRGGPREGAGRKPRGEMATPLLIRVTEEEREAYESAARSERLSLSDWARRTLSLRAAAGGGPL